MYVPDYDDAEVKYTVKTYTSFTYSDEYFLMGYADDYVDDLKLGGGELYNDWEWNMGEWGTIYAWGDGFCYPLGYFTEEGSWKNVEFVFGEKWQAGLLDFQFISYTYQQDKLLKETPKFQATASEAQIVYTKLKNSFISGQIFYAGSNWTGDPNHPEGNPWRGKRFVSTTQFIGVFGKGFDPGDGEYHNYGACVKLSFSIGWLCGYASEWANLGLMIDLNYVPGCARTFEMINLQDVTVDIYTPIGVVDIGGLVFMDTPNKGDSIVDSGFKIGITSYSALMAYAATSSFGPIGAITGAAFTAGVEELYEYIKDQQEEAFGLNAFGLNHKQVWYNELFSNKFFSLPYSKSHVTFIELLPATKGRCGALKFVFHGKLGLYHWMGYVRDLWDYIIVDFSTTIVVPFFVPPL
jgi:hypothetical protein